MSLYLPSVHMIEPICSWAEKLQSNTHGLSEDELSQSMSDLMVSVSHHGLEDDEHVQEALMQLADMPTVDKALSSEAVSSEALSSEAVSSEAVSSEALSSEAPPSGGKVAPALVAPAFTRGARMRSTVSRRKSF